MAQYHFVSRWHVDAPIDDVFDVITHSERWPSWWKGVETVTELAGGDADGVGSRRHYVWKSLLPYRLGFDVTAIRVDRPHTLEGTATGELAGTGRWELRDAPAGGTDITYYWDVRTTKRWMNVLGLLAGPAFRWNHDYVMNDGQRGIAKLFAGRGSTAGAPTTKG